MRPLKPDMKPGSFLDVLGFAAPSPSSHKSSAPSPSHSSRPPLISLTVLINPNPDGCGGSRPPEI